MAIDRCPGMNPAFFKPEDIQIHKCIDCGEELEFWKDDVRLTCEKCGKVNYNPDLENTCLSWCKSATECLGGQDIREWLKKQKK